jgi:hypothetical protein
MRRVSVVSVLSSSVMAVMVAVFAPASFAQSALSNGGNHVAVLQVGGLDAWTFTATKNDGIAVSLGKVLTGGSDPIFYPWIRLKAPDGLLLAQDLAGFGSQNSVQIDSRAPLTGTYTVLVANNATNQASPAGYVLTMAKTPGPYLVSAGDEGGPLTNGAHSAVLGVGDLDAWTVQAAINSSIAVSLGKVPGSGSDPIFYPWIRIKSPDGLLLAQDLAGFGSQNSVQVDIRAPQTGTYTVLVANNATNQASPANYVLTLAGPSSGFSIAGILAVAGSTPGSGAYFRTRVQIHNPRTSPISGKFVFHTQSVSGASNDPSLAYTLSGGQTIDYPDLLPAMGIASGLGSIDIMTTPGDPVPVISARIFSDAGVNGSAGFFIEPLTPDAALQTGDSAVIIAPADPAAARLNLGVRSLEAGASFLITVRSKNGAVRNTVNKTYAPTFFEQVNANSYVGVVLDPSDTITFTIISGKALIYGSQTDNETQDPSVQFAKRTF